MRAASEVVKRARSFQSRILLRIGQRVADARSVLAILLLCGTMGSVIDLEVSGADEEEALSAISAVFEEANGSEWGNSTHEPENGVG